MEHQHVLLVTELLTKNALQQNINLEQEQKLVSLSNQSKENPKKSENGSIKPFMMLYLVYMQYRKLQANEEKQKKVIDQQQETISELRQKISELRHPVEPKSFNYRFYSSS